jgi:hypothetical protein
MSNYSTKDILRSVDNPSLLRKVVEKLLNQKIAVKLDQKKQEIQKNFVREDVVSSLKEIIATGAKPVRFLNGQQMTVDLQTAKMLLAVHEKLNKDMQDKFQRMVNSDPQQFMKVVDFGWKQLT